MKVHSREEVEDAATRAVARLPPQLAVGEIEEVKRAFEKLPGHHKLSRAECPSQANLERKLGEVTTSFRAESFITVTNLAQADENKTSVPWVDP